MLKLFVIILGGSSPGILFQRVEGQFLKNNRRGAYFYSGRIIRKKKKTRKEKLSHRCNKKLVILCKSSTTPGHFHKSVAAIRHFKNFRKKGKEVAAAFFAVQHLVTKLYRVILNLFSLKKKKKKISSIKFS